MSASVFKEHAHELLDRIDQSDLPTAVRFLEFMLLDPASRAIATAPADSLPLTAEESAALDSADEWLRENGAKGIPHEEVLAEFGFQG